MGHQAKGYCKLEIDGTTIPTYAAITTAFEENRKTVDVPSATIGGTTITVPTSAREYVPGEISFMDRSSAADANATGNADAFKLSTILKLLYDWHFDKTTKQYRSMVIRWYDDADMKGTPIYSQRISRAWPMKAPPLVGEIASNDSNEFSVQFRHEGATPEGFAGA